MNCKMFVHLLIFTFILICVLVQLMTQQYRLWDLMQSVFGIVNKDARSFKGSSLITKLEQNYSSTFKRKQQSKFLKQIKKLLLKIFKKILTKWMKVALLDWE